MLLRESILEVDGEGAGEGRWESGGGYREEEEQGWERMMGRRVAAGEIQGC